MMQEVELCMEQLPRIVTQGVNGCVIQHADFFRVFRAFRGLTAVFRLKGTTSMK